MSPVKPCTLTVAWSWYRRRCQPATLAELAWLVNSCYVTLAFSAARRGDTVIADGAEKAPCRSDFRAIQRGKERMSDVNDRVKKIVVEHLGVDESKVTENASFIDDLGADSLDTVELVMAFEEEFGCEIPDDAAEKIVTVKDAVNFIESHS